jgi:hypothetical protein
LLAGLVIAGVLSRGSALLYAAEPSAVKAGGQGCSEQEVANNKIIESTFANGPCAALELVGPVAYGHINFRGTNAFPIDRCAARIPGAAA